MPTKEILEIPLSRLVIDPSLQVRVEGLDGPHVTALVEVLDRLPPPKAVRQGREIVIEDGHHTVAAFQNAGRETIKVQIVQAPSDGDLYAAAFEANRLHGKALTLRDKTAFAEHLLRRDPATPNMRVASRAGLSAGTVASIREHLESEQAITPTDRTVTRGESTYSYPGQTRKAGELPPERIAESVGRIFNSAERCQQRKTASYFKRLAVSLDELFEIQINDLDSVVESIRLVLGDEEAKKLGGRLGLAAGTVVLVAEGLGYREGN